MTIGGEKVVERFDVIGTDVFRRDGGFYVMYSAYAELAAERDLAISARNAADERHDELKEELESAESQLAELRGKLEGLERYDPYMRYDPYVEEGSPDMEKDRHGEWVKWDDLRALAAADGGAG